MRLPQQPHERIDRSEEVVFSFRGKRVSAFLGDSIGSALYAEPAREGVQVEPQNVWGSLDHDLLAVTDKIGGPFPPVGFYYRTMIRPRRAWPLYERFLRSVAGLGRLDPHAERSARYDVEHRRTEVLVVGGGS